MSVSELKRTRGELYKEYNAKKKSEWAKKILGTEYSYSNELMSFGGTLLTSAIMTVALFLIVMDGATHGFGPMPDAFYPVVGSVVGGIGYLAASSGLVMLAIGYCQKRDILDERLSELDVDNIIGEPLEEVTEL